ncbi:hypothetical protein EUB48_15190 [Rhodoferax sediminis]|uniref:Transposase IS701-like DDE domain-containing protein n=1 Tax=Rhodoferax sediminis TaxID=2509614 RepID=A0A515DDJ4_9BURK|nr:hypothetical protein EUB48_15190 [Rhodoferax sediminis]
MASGAKGIGTVFAQNPPRQREANGEPSPISCAAVPQAQRPDDEAKNDVPALVTFAGAHWHQIYSTSPLERHNAEIKRRTDVVGSDGGWWIIDDTGFPKKGCHSVGVGRQYCGMLGKQDNCQVAVSISLASNEWPANDAERSKYVLSTLPEETPINELVSVAHQRWRIERDYQDLKQDFGLGHYEGRGWRGFHHHAALSIAAYGFLMAERLVTDKSLGGKKNFINRQVPVLPEDYIPRGSPARTAARGNLNHNTAPSTKLSADRSTRAVSLLRQSKRKTALVTVRIVCRPADSCAKSL